MAWFHIDIADADGIEYRDQIEASTADVARITIEDMGYILLRMRRNRFKSAVTGAYECVDRIFHPKKYDPDTALEYLLERERRKNPGLSDD